EFIRREFRNEFERIELQRPRASFVERRWANGVEHGPLFQLKPDIFLKRPNGARMIVDTKYKLLDSEDEKKGVEQPDLYQMYSDARNGDSPDFVLLYPQVGNVKHDVCFQIESGPPIRIFGRTVDLRRDLRLDKAGLRQELARNLTTPPFVAAAAGA